MKKYLNRTRKFVAVTVGVSIGLLGIQSTLWAAAPDGPGPWADAVVDYSPGLRDNGTAVEAARAIPESALGVAEDNDTINFVALGYGGSLTLSFENGIANGPGSDFRVVETTYNNQTCEQYPERATLEVSADNVNWYGAPGVTGDCQDLEFDLEDVDLECILYVRITDTTNAGDFSVNHITDGYDVDGVQSLHEGSCQPPQDFEYQCDAGFLYTDVNNSSTEADLYLVDYGTGVGELKKTYAGDFRNNLAVDNSGNVFAIDRTTRDLVQLMPDGTVDVVVATDIPTIEGTLTIAPDGTMYAALNNDELYSVDMGTGHATMLVDLTGDEVDVNGGDIVVDEENVMTIINTEGEVWTVDLGAGNAVASLGNVGKSIITGMAYDDGWYYITNHSNDKVYKFTHNAITAVLVGSFGVNFGSGDAASCAPDRLDASISVEKSAVGYVEPFEVNEGEDVVYTYAVSNTGDLPVTNLSVVDDVCGDATYVDDGGDANVNGKLDIDEVWNYTCTQSMDGVFGLVVNTVTVNGDDPFGDPVEPAEDTLETTVKAAGCTLTQGYWKTHGDSENVKKYDEEWDNILLLPGTVYTSPSVQTLLWEQSKGNYWYMLFSQYIAAFLNSQTASVPSTVQDALDSAANLLIEPNKDALEAKGKTKNKDLHKEFVSVAGVLANYNEGGTIVPHCSEI